VGILILDRLGGFAGTGKTTLAKRFAESAAMRVVFLQLYGQGGGCSKAEGVSRGQNNRPAALPPSVVLVLHARKAVRRSRRVRLGALPLCTSAVSRKAVEQGGAARRRSRCGRRGQHVDEQHGTDMLGFGVPILVLADPAQLPPPKGRGFFTSRNPDLLLTEVHRQASGNPILILAGIVRNCRQLRLGSYSASAVVSQYKIEPKNDWLNFDRIIVGSNAFRVTVNKHYRGLLGYSDQDLPQRSERAICLENNFDKGLANGQTFSVIETGDVKNGFLEMEVGDGTDIIPVHARLDAFHAEKPKGRGSGQVFDFAYAITAHKLQDSEWSRVLVYDQSGIFRMTGIAGCTPRLLAPPTQS
jgi:exodeoxyribonuclease V